MAFYQRVLSLHMQRNGGFNPSAICAGVSTQYINRPGSYPIHRMWRVLKSPKLITAQAWSPHNDIRRLWAPHWWLKGSRLLVLSSPPGSQSSLCWAIGRPRSTVYSPDCTEFGHLWITALLDSEEKCIRFSVFKGYRERAAVKRPGLDTAFFNPQFACKLPVEAGYVACTATDGLVFPRLANEIIT